MEQLKADGKHIEVLKKAVEMTTQKKVESYRLTKSWITFVFDDGSIHEISMKDFNLFELYNVLLKG